MINVTVTGNAQKVKNDVARMERRFTDQGVVTFLTQVVHPWFSDRIVERFAYEGDASVGGPWEPLADSTIRMKSALGYPLDTNERTGEMMMHLAYDYEIEHHGMYVAMQIPGESDPLMEKKLRTAQEGDHSNPLFPGGVTPPRPVLGVGTAEEAFLQGAAQQYFSGAFL